MNRRPFGSAIVLQRIFPGNSELAARMRHVDWAATPLGRPDAWPEPLWVAIGLCLGSGFATQVLWGPQLTLLYNDASIALFGPRKHPHAIGRPAREAWSEAWPQIGPLVEQAMGMGAQPSVHEVRLVLDRKLQQEEVHARLSFSPILGLPGEVLGLLCTCIETSQVRELLRRLVNAQEDERRRISRELHDTLGQHLSAVTLGLKTLRANPHCPPAVAEGLDRVGQAAAQLDDAMDRLAYEVRPAVLDDLGLADALHSHAQGWTLQSGIPIELHTRGLSGRLPAEIEVTVYRVVQEALTNIHKHAQASRVGVITERRGDDLRVIVEDDGCGFDAGEPDPLTDGRRRFGLRGMGERAGLVGGKVQVESAPGKGTTVYLTVPIAAA